MWIPLPKVVQQNASAEPQLESQHNDKHGRVQRPQMTRHEWYVDEDEQQGADNEQRSLVLVATLCRVRLQGRLQGDRCLALDTSSST